MPHLRFECVCDHAELITHRRLVDYFQRGVTRLVHTRAEPSCALIPAPRSNTSAWLRP